MPRADPYCHLTVAEFVALRATWRSSDVRFAPFLAESVANELTAADRSQPGFCAELVKTRPHSVGDLPCFSAILMPLGKVPKDWKVKVNNHYITKEELSLIFKEVYEEKELTETILENAVSDFNGRLDNFMASLLEDVLADANQELTNTKEQN